MKLFYRTVTLLATAAVLDLISLTALAFPQLPPTTQTRVSASQTLLTDGFWRGEEFGRAALNTETMY